MKCVSAGSTLALVCLARAASAQPPPSLLAEPPPPPPVFPLLDADGRSTQVSAAASVLFVRQGDFDEDAQRLHLDGALVTTVGDTTVGAYGKVDAWHFLDESGLGSPEVGVTARGAAARSLDVALRIGYTPGYASSLTAAPRFFSPLPNFDLDDAATGSDDHSITGALVSELTHGRLVARGDVGVRRLDGRSLYHAHVGVGVGSAKGGVSVTMQNLTDDRDDTIWVHQLALTVHANTTAGPTLYASVGALLYDAPVADADSGLGDRTIVSFGVTAPLR